MTGTSDFAKVEWTSATFLRNRIPCVSNSARNVQISALRNRVQKREELKYTVRSALAKFGVDFNKDVYSKWVKRHRKCTACRGSNFDKE